MLSSVLTTVSTFLQKVIFMSKFLQELPTRTGRLARATDSAELEVELTLGRANRETAPTNWFVCFKFICLSIIYFFKTTLI